MRVFSIEMFQEAKEFLMCMGINTPPLCETLTDEQGGQRPGCAMPDASMGMALCLVRSQGQHRLGSIKRVDF